MKLFTKSIDDQLFKQYPLGGDLENQKVIAKIFNPYGRGTWYIINSDPSDPDYLWAIVDLFEVEVGSVSRMDLETIKVPPFRLGLERDTSFQPKNAQEIYRGLLAGKHFAEGGETEGGENKEMLENQAKNIQHHAKELHEVLDKTKEVEPWVITKVQRATTDLADVTHYLDGENSEKMAEGGMVKWQDAEVGDSALVVSENKMGVIMKPYGRKFHLKFVDGTEKTYDASELKFIKDEDEYADGGMTSGDATTFRVMFFKAVKASDGSRVEVMRDEKFYKGDLKDVMSDVYQDFYSTDVYALINDRKKQFSVARVNSDGSVRIIDEGYGLSKGDSINLEKRVEEKKEENAPQKKRFGFFEEGGVMAKGGEVSVKVGDRVKKKTKVGSGVSYGIDGIVYEVNGRFFKLKDKYGNESNKLHDTRDFKQSDIKSMASGGMMAKGGKTESEEVVYIAYRNAKKKFALDKKYFRGENAYNEAVRWGRKNIDNFNMDMVKFEMASGGELEVGFLDELPKEYNSYNYVMTQKFPLNDGNITYLIYAMSNDSSITRKIYSYMNESEDFEDMSVGQSNRDNLEKQIKLNNAKIYFKTNYADENEYDIAYFDSYNDDNDDDDNDDEYASGGMMADGGYMEKGEGMSKIERMRKIKNREQDEKMSKIERMRKIKNREQDEKMSKIERMRLLKNKLSSQKDSQSNSKQKMAMGGKVKFADKVESVKKSLLERKKVPKSVQKDYGKTFSPKEAEESAKRIVGAQTARERLQMRIKKGKK